MHPRFLRGASLIAGLTGAIVSRKVTTATQQISDEKIANANARGEEAKEKAVEAQLKLEQLRKQLGPHQLQ